MGLDSQMKDLVNKNLDTSISVFNEIKSSKDVLKKYTENFGVIENAYEFIHGHMIGQIEGEAFAMVRTTLGKSLTDEEREDLVKIVKSKRPLILDLIERLKNA